MLQAKLSNGIQVVLKANHFSPTVAVQAWVGVGSLHERADERGMAHFLEHMLFKGTDRRAVGEIAATVEACGGEINAYTTFDHTVYHLTLAAPHAAVGVDLLADAFGHSKLDPEEFAREKEVILEEIRRSHDSPGARVGRRVFELAFAGTEAGRPIIGSTESVSGFARDELHAFYKRWYHPGNVTVIAVGDFDEETMLRLVTETFGALPVAKGETPSKHIPVLQSPARRPDGARPGVSLIKGDFQQPRLEIVFPGPHLNDLDGAALDLAAFALGAGEMSRCNRRLRDGDGTVTSVGASVYTPTFGGLFELSALCTEEDLPAAVTGLAREATLLREKEGISDDELARARANLKADRIFRDETVDGQARSIGFGMMTEHRMIYDEIYAAQVNALPATAVDSAVRRWMRPEDATLVVLVNEASAITEAQIADAFVKGVAEARKESGKTRRAAAKKATLGDAEVIQLKPGVKLVYRHREDGELFTLTAATEGGLRAETPETVGLFNALSGMLCTASENHSYEAMMTEIEGMGASLEGFSGKDSLGMHVQCLAEHAPRMLALFRECLLTPVFPEEQWASLQRELLQTLATQNDSPSGICIRRFQELMFGEHPYRYSLVGTEDVVSKLTTKTMLDTFQRFRDTGPWVLAVAGALPTTDVVRMITDALKGFEPDPKPRTFPSDQLVKTPKGGTLRVAKDREQAHIVYGFHGITWGDPDRAALDVLVNVLGGHGGRLFKTLRDRDSLAYSVSPIVSYGRHPGVVGSYIACAPGKTAKALASLKDEMLALIKDPPAAAEVDRAKAYIIGTHDMSLQKSDAQTSTMALMELYGYGYDDFLTYPKVIAKVTVADVAKVAKRLFRPEGAADVVVGPQ